MPSTNTDSKTTNTPWKGYQPYLVGNGAMPEWLTQGAPTGVSDNLMADIMARASGAEGSWNQVPPVTDPYQYAPPMASIMNNPSTDLPGRKGLLDENDPFGLRGNFDWMNG